MSPCWKQRTSYIEIYACCFLRMKVRPEKVVDHGSRPFSFFGNNGRRVSGGRRSLRVPGMLPQRKAACQNGRTRRKYGRNGSLNIVKRTALLASNLGMEEHVDFPMFLGTLCAREHTSALCVLCFVSLLFAMLFVFCVLCSLFYNYIAHSLLS